MSRETQQTGGEGPGPARRGTDMYDVLAWVEVNRKLVGTVLLVLVLGGFAIAIWRYMQEQKELSASNELLGLKVTLAPSTNVPPPQASSLLRVAQEFSGTHAGQRAQYLGAVRLFEEGKYAEAEAEFGRFIGEHRGTAWAAGAAYGQAASLEALGRTNEAFRGYQQVATTYPNSAVTESAKLAQARMHEERNEPEQALRIYNELAPSVPGMPREMMANPEVLQRKEALLRAHPQLDTATNQPAAFQMPGISPVELQSGGVVPLNEAQPEPEPRLE